MTMESPVRICLGAALVVNLLLLASTARGNALPHEPATTVKDERQPKLSRNSTWAPSTHKPTPDVALNELHPKESVSESEEHTEKNAKYKHRGRVRFHSQLKSSTESNLRRIRTSSPSTTTTTLPPKSASAAAKLIIVTPTPEVKKPAQIIDSMRIYKRTKMPVSSSSTTSSTPEAVELDTEEEEEYEDEDDKEEEDDVKEDRDNFEKYLTSKFPDSNFFTIPSYNDDFSHDSDSADNKLKSHYKKPHDTFSSYFPDVSYGPSTKDEPYKAESFFNFDSELTTPKNDFFDKKFEEISKGIIKNLESTKTKVPQSNETVFKVIKGNTGLEKLTNGTPTNKSTVIIKNTKEIRLLDNEHASSDPKALSDVQGTSIYYEMSVLSTETYNINHTNDDDCDNDTGPEPTISTSADEELASVKATQSSLATASTKASIVSSSSEYVSTLSSNYFPFSSPVPTHFSTVIPELPVYSTQTVGTEYDKTRTYSSSFSRNRNYSKRLNFNEVKDSPNNVTPRGEQSLSIQSIRQNTRKFAYTTPKTKPVWMAPRRNATRTSYTRTTTPRTIYEEHFNIKDKTTTNLPRQPSRTTLTTVSSEIDPVKQGDVSGVKKIVHSPSISDNSIPSLWKRGSTKFASSTATSKEEEGSGISDLEIPPTLTAWALASLRSPPHQPSVMMNASTSTHKSVDENELQKVGDVTDKKETTTSSSATKTTTNSINNDILPKITEIVQNRLPWRPGVTSKVITEKPSETSDSENESESLSESENKSESLPAESNLSLQSSVKPASTTEEINVEVTEAATTPESPETTETESKDSEKSWVSATEESLEQEQTSTENLKVIPPVDATKSTGFESITKLPAGITTPQDETIASSEDKTEAVTRFKEPTTATENTAPVTIPTTTDYEITTIRFSYVPTQADTESSIKETTMSSWHPVFPTRTKTTTIKDEPVTTYRPKFMTTTDSNEEITTTITESSSQESTSQKVNIITEISVESNSEESTPDTPTSKSTTKSTSTPKSASAETTESSQETTTIIVEVITEINTERESSKSSSTESSSETDTNESDTPPSEIRESSSENSGSNEVITQENKVIVTTPKSKTTTEEKTTHSKGELTTVKDLTTQGHVFSVTTVKEESPEELETVKSVTETDEEMGLTSEATTETSRLGGPEEAGSGAAVAIAVSTIGVIALILLVGLLLVVRRRGRRGVYAQRCTPVSLDAYSLDSVSVGHRKGNHRLRASKRSYGNPAYDDEVTSHPMQYAALANFALDMESMTAEFSEIPSVTVRPDEVPPGCEDKNRYSNVLPLPETRVPLTRIGNDPTTEYINANYITGPGNIRNYYIACQAPLPNTVVDFWRMIWEQNSRVIVMLTEYMENGVEKCYEYLPPSEISDNRRIFGDFKIVLMKREQKDKYAISSVQLINTATRTWREITHLWYFWPAKGVPDDYDSVIDFLSEMRSYMKISQTAKEYDEEGVEVIYGDQSRSSFHNVSKLRSDDNSSGNGVNVYSPVRAEEQLKRGTNGTLGRMKTASEIEAIRPCVVVCASGAGRSAAIIAADICARALAAAAADVPRVVRELRAQRPHSLSNRHHYIFLYKVLAEYGNKLMGGGVDTL